MYPAINKFCKEYEDGLKNHVGRMSLTINLRPMPLEIGDLLENKFLELIHVYKNAVCVDTLRICWISTFLGRPPCNEEQKVFVQSVFLATNFSPPVAIETLNDVFGNVSPSISLEGFNIYRLYQLGLLAIEELKSGLLFLSEVFDKIEGVLFVLNLEVGQKDSSFIAHQGRKSVIQSIFPDLNIPPKTGSTLDIGAAIDNGDRINNLTAANRYNSGLLYDLLLSERFEIKISGDLSVNEFCKNTLFLTGGRDAFGITKADFLTIFDRVIRSSKKNEFGMKIHSTKFPFYGLAICHHEKIELGYDLRYSFAVDMEPEVSYNETNLESLDELLALTLRWMAGENVVDSTRKWKFVTD